MATGLNSRWNEPHTRPAQGCGTQAATPLGRWAWLRRALSFRPMGYSGVIALLLATGLVAFPEAARAYEWQLVQGDEEQAVFVDRGSIEREGHQASAWILKSFSSRIELGHRLYPHRSQKLYYEFNCNDATYHLDKWVMTEGAYGEGEVVWTGYSRFDERLAMASNSAEAAAAALVCAPGELLGRLN